MQPTDDQFGDYLAPEESLVTVSAATLFEDSSWKQASIGLTDRRLLCVAEDGFLTAGYDAICTVRTRPRTSPTFRGSDYRLLLGGGALVAVLGGIGLIALASTPLVPLFGFLTVSAVAAAEYLRRGATVHERLTAGDVVERVPFDLDEDDVSLDAVDEYIPSERDLATVRRRLDRRVPDDHDVRQLAMLGSGVVAALGFVGLIVVASGWLVVLSALAVLTGVAVVDYGHRHREDFDGVDAVQREETEVRISTDDGETIHIRSDRSAEISRALSRMAFAADEESDYLVSSPS